MPAFHVSIPLLKINFAPAGGAQRALTACSCAMVVEQTFV
jgi:hypothetical protein